MYRLSRCVLLAHEDKVFSRRNGRFDEYSLGETKGDQDLGVIISCGRATWCRVQARCSPLADGHAASRIGLAGSHSAAGRQFSAKQLD